MESLAAPKTIKYYQLIKMTTKSNLYFSAVGSTPNQSVGIGFFRTLDEAEHNRTLETLKDTDPGSNSYYVFELEFPNPAYRE